VEASGQKGLICLNAAALSACKSSLVFGRGIH
jgi:hypothetical protein